MTAARSERTTAQWLADLRDPTPPAQTLDELRAYLKNTLARALRSRGDVSESDLDDFTQDALIQILRGLDSFRGDSRFTTWATAVAVRCALGSLRRRRHREASLDELADAGAPTDPAGADTPDPARELGRKTLLDALSHAIEHALTKRQRTVILGELAGTPAAVLVERLGTNPNALYKLHHDARKKLKRALNDAGYSDDDVRSELLAASEAL